MSQTKAFLVGGALLVVGGVAGYSLANHQAKRAKLSEAERRYPKFVQDVARSVEQVLKKWRPKSNAYCEDDHTDDMADYLEDLLPWRIEVRKPTDIGSPDLLIGDVLAVELKLGMKKTEADRSLGQCGAYSDRWATWLVMVNGSSEWQQKLPDLFAARGLGHIPIWLA